MDFFVPIAQLIMKTFKLIYTTGPLIAWINYFQRNARLK